MKHEAFMDSDATAPKMAHARPSADAMRAIAEAAREAQIRSRRQDNSQRDADIEALRLDFLSRSIDPDFIDRTVRHVEHAAAQGKTSVRVYTFPSEFSLDHGRAINNEESGWPATLCGEAASVLAALEAELIPLGFRVAAQIVSWPELMPGDVGIFLIWDKSGN